MRKSKKSSRRAALASLARPGPGLITAVADDDPSGIATYSQAGAQFGLNTLWTMPLSYPLMSAVQSICAPIGRVTGHGLAFNLKQAFPLWVVYGSVLLLLIANNGITDVQTAVQAAQALRPVAGDLAFYLFAAGIIGVGMLAVPVLAGSAGYALAETMGWRWGLEASARQAQRFYGIIVFSMLGALGPRIHQNQAHQGTLLQRRH